MSYNSKSVRAVAEFSQCTSRSNLSEGACQNLCENSQNLGRYGQIKTTYIKGASFKFHYESSVTELVILFMGTINLIRDNFKHEGY